MPSRSCGGCQHWTKWKRDGRGLCELHDSSGKSDHGAKCTSWKHKVKPKYATKKNLGEEKNKYAIVNPWE